MFSATCYFLSILIGFCFGLPMDGLLERDARHLYHQGFPYHPRRPEGGLWYTKSLERDGKYAPLIHHPFFIPSQIGEDNGPKIVHQEYPPVHPDLQTSDYYLRPLMDKLLRLKMLALLLGLNPPAHVYPGNIHHGGGYPEYSDLDRYPNIYSTGHIGHRPASHTFGDLPLVPSRVPAGMYCPPGPKGGPRLQT